MNNKRAHIVLPGQQTRRFLEDVTMRFTIGFAGHMVVAVAVIAIQLLSPAWSSQEPTAVQRAPRNENKWFVEFGPLWKAGGDVDVRIKSLPDLSRYHRPVLPRNDAIGPINAVADRTYHDGYVKQDYGTGVWDNNTWYWGYDSADQIVSDQLLFHSSTRSVDGESFRPRDSFSLDLDDEIGGEARIGRNLFTCDSATGCLVLGLGFTSFNGSTAFEDLGYVRIAREQRITDTYNLLTGPGDIPPAPYSGTKEGPGYLIPNIPAQRQVSGERSTPLAEIHHRVHQDIDVDLWGVSLGLDIRGKGHKVAYIVGAGLSGNFVSADSDVRWTASENGVALDSARFSQDDSTFELGAYGEAGLLFHLSGRISLALRARYDHLFDDAEVSFSNTNASIDLSGFSALATLGIAF